MHRQKKSRRNTNSSTSLLIFSQISINTILKNEINNSTEVGKQAKSYVDEGKLVPDKIVVDLVRKGVANSSLTRILVDGFPMTLEQAKKFDGILLDREKTLYAVIYLEIPSSKLKERIGGDGAESEVVKNKLSEFRRNIEPVLSYYEDKRLLRKVNADQDIDTVWGLVDKEMFDAMSDYKTAKGRGMRKELDSEGDGRREAQQKIIDEPRDEENQKANK